MVTNVDADLVEDFELQPAVKREEDRFLLRTVFGVLQGVEMAMT